MSDKFSKCAKRKQKKRKEKKKRKNGNIKEVERKKKFDENCHFANNFLETGSLYGRFFLSRKISLTKGEKKHDKLTSEEEVNFIIYIALATRSKNYYHWLLQKICRKQNTQNIYNGHAR